MKLLWFVLTENVRRVVFWRAVGSELLATAIFVFIGCGSIVLQLNDVAPISPSTTIRIALAFGFAINILIKTFGPVSGCHINPAVSIGFMIVGKVSLVRVVFYTVAQLAGSVIGAGLLYSILPPKYRITLGTTRLHNSLTPTQGFATEIILTFILVLAISACLDEKRIDHFKMKITNPLTIGLTIAALHLVGIPFTGASMNPARSFGPAVITLRWSDHWIYWLGPIFGACFSTITYHFLFLISPEVLVKMSNRLGPAPTTSGETVPPSNVNNSCTIVSYNRNISVASSNNSNTIEVPVESYNVAAVAPAIVNVHHQPYPIKPKPPALAKRNSNNSNNSNNNNNGNNNEMVQVGSTSAQVV